MSNVLTNHLFYGLRQEDRVENVIRDSHLVKRQPSAHGFLMGSQTRLTKLDPIRELMDSSVFSAQRLSMNDSYIGDGLLFLKPSRDVVDSDLVELASAIYRCGNKNGFSVIACQGYNGNYENRALCFYRPQKYAIFSDAGVRNARLQFEVGSEISTLDYWLIHQLDYYKTLQKRELDNQA